MGIGKTAENFMEVLGWGNKVSSVLAKKENRLNQEHQIYTFLDFYLFSLLYLEKNNNPG